MTLPTALRALGAHVQFITYLPVPLPTGKIDKIPRDYRTGATHVNPHDPQYWTDYDTAFRTGYPVGFVLTNTDPFFCLDIDGCLQNGAWSETALSVLREFPGAAVEVSMSGTGLHVWGRHTSIPPHGCKNIPLGLELYHAARFIALGRPDAVGDAATDCTKALLSVIPRYFSGGSESRPVGDWEAVCARGPAPEWNGPADDAELIRRALRSQSLAGMFGKKAQFVDLWTRNETVLAVAYPDPIRPFDESSADAALAAHLRFWTGGDAARIKRLMEQSGLVREKYGREDYLPRTILSVLSSKGDVLQDPLPSNPAAASVPQIAAHGGQIIAGREMQEQIFKGCVYITERNEVWMPTRLYWNEKQFNNRLSNHVFVMDNENGKTEQSAWTCFMRSKLFDFPKVDREHFRPDLPSGGITRDEAGITYLNSYVPSGVKPVEGDAAPFTDLLERMFPIKKDRDILIAYLAFLVQYPGVKSQWAPLIQGVEGNGKSTINECIVAAIGEDYCESPRASMIAKQFNGWMYGTIFAGVEDVYLPDGRDVFEDLKPMITQTRLEVEFKGRDKTTVRICTNFILNSNHKDGMRKTRNDRRIAPLYAAQQEVMDLNRDGLTEAYFRTLRNWLEKEKGYAIVAGFLHTYAIPDALNPANGWRAPITSSTEEAIHIGLDPIEQEIQERVDQGKPGFAGGWISSFAVDQLLISIRATLPRNKRRSVLASLGYHPHSGLTGGRVNNPIPDSGMIGKPCLYVKAGHLSLNLKTGGEIARAYQEAQNAVERSLTKEFGT